MALGLDQGVQWHYIPPVITDNQTFRDVDDYICANELVSFLSRLQDPGVQEYLAHPRILSALRPGTLLHVALCATNGRSCNKSKRLKGSILREPGIDLQGISSPPRGDITKGDPPIAKELRKMQSPRPAMIVFILCILLEIKDKTSDMLAPCLTPTLNHFFVAIERALYENDSARHPYDLENVLMLFIRGIELNTVPCSASLGLCLWHGFGPLCSKRFPSWPLLFSVMRIMGGWRSLSSDTRKMLELNVQNIVVAPRWFVDASLDMTNTSDEEYHILDCGKSGITHAQATLPINPAFDHIKEPDLNGLSEQIRLELGL